MTTTTIAMFICTKSEFDIFAQKPLQTAILETRETLFKPVATVDQSGLQFVVPGDNETFIDLNIHVYVKGKLIKPDGTDFDATKNQSLIKTQLHSVEL